jgi:CRISPR/Cas system type I-B associated protein Csh2 (Cas7 group RAMP superfamily)
MPLNNVDPAVCTYDALTKYPIELCDHTGSRTMAATINEPRDRTLWTREKVPYALYVGSSVTFPDNLANNGVSDEDLAFYVEALVKCWEHTNSGFRGVNNLRGFWAVRHKGPLGSCPDWVIQECLKIRCDDPSAASSYGDYEVSFDRALLENRGLRVLDLDEVYGNWEAVVR